MTVSATIVTQYYTGIFRQAPSAAVSSAYQAMANDAAALNSMLSAANLTVDPVVRLYQTAFNRLPDNAGFTAWVVPFSTGQLALQTIANGFTQSTEFTTLYPTSMTNSQYVGALYWNILQRAGEDAGMKGWVDALNSGALTRAQVLLGFSESGEFTKNIEPSVNTFLTSIANTALANQGNASLYTGSLFDQAGAPTTTWNLTTNIDTFVATAASNVFNGSLGTGATLNSFDTIQGSGQSTFNLVDSTNAVFGATSIPASATISGMTTVNLSRSGAAGATTNAATVANTTFGTGVQTFNLVDAGTGNQGAVAVTLNSAKSVSVKSTGTNAFATVTVTDTDATSTATQGSTLTSVTIQNSAGANALNGNGITTVALNAAAGLTTITSAAGTRALTINASGTTAQGGLTDAQATSATLNISGNQAFGTLTVAKATAVNINATASAAANSTTATIVAAKMTALNVGGTHAQTLTLTNANNPLLATVTVTGSGGVALGDLSAFTVLTLVDTSAATNVASATGAANATIANSVTLANTTAFTGGAGTDTVTVGATTKTVNLGTGANTANVTVTALGTGGSIVGDGNDTLGLSDANAQTLSTAGTTQTNFKAAVTGFSTLALGALTGNTTIDAQGFGSFNAVTLTSAANNIVTINNLASGSTITETAGGAALAGTGFTTGGTLGSGANDVLNVVLKFTGAIAAFGTITTPNLANLNITVTDTAATPVGYLNTATIVDTALRTLTVGGTSGLNLGTIAGATTLTSIDASGITGAGGFGVTTAALQFASTIKGSSGTGSDTINAAAALAATTISTTATGTNTITGSSGFANTITVGNGTNTITGGSAVDTVTLGTGTNTVTGLGGKDAITINHGGLANVNTVAYTTSTTSAAAAGANMDTITNFTSGVDKIKIQISTAAGTNTAGDSTLNFVAAAASTFGTMAAAISDANSVATLTDVYTQLGNDLTAGTFAASATGANNLVARVVNFTTGAASGTYLVLNDNQNGFQAGTDVVIKLVGGTTVVAGDFAYGAV